MPKRTRAIYGTSRPKFLRTAALLKIPLYLDIKCQDASSFTIVSEHNGVLYRELKVSMTRWAIAHQQTLTDVFATSVSRFAEHYQLDLKQVDSPAVLPVTYDRLLEMVESGQAASSDQIALSGEPGEKSWVTVKEAGREDPTLRILVDPLGYGIRDVLWLSLGIAVAVVVGGGLTWATSTYFPAISREWNPLWRYWAAGAVLFLALFGMLSLRYGILQWTKRLSLSRAQRLGLRLLTGVAVPVLAFGLAWLAKVLVSAIGAV